jgi:DNA-binding response OmpR family regulator
MLLTHDPDARPSRVLVVDEDLAVLRLCERVLGAGGYQVVSATDPAQALVRIADGAFDAVLIDIDLPGQDGLQLLREMRGRGLVAPVLLMTAFPSLDTLVSGTENGAVGYLIKPFDARQLARALVTAEQVHTLG